MASADRIDEVLASRPDVRPSPRARPLEKPEGRVSFESVSFGYDGASVLREVSFTAEPGETIAVLGATGSGKSTLVSLIPRFYDASAGRILIDGIDVRDLAEESLRRCVAVAMQDTVLFTGSVADNIRYARPEASEAEVRQAAEAAQAARFIEHFPDGYATAIGQRGVGLSGGQRQRVAIARALLARPSILVFDDCTSAVDAETESKILDALRSRQDGTMMFLVTQRVSPALTADRILLLDDGRLVGYGTHSELAACSALYREICDAQLEPEGADG